MNKFVSLTLLVTALACSRQQTSHTSGHYEQADKSSMEKLAQELNPIALAEHDLTHSVIISLDLVMDTHVDEQGYERGMQHTDIAKGILDAGVELIIVTDKAFELASHPYLMQLKMVLGDDISKVKFVPAYADYPVIWARDWGPIQALDNQGRPLLLDFNYYPERPEGDFVPSVLVNEKISNQRLSVPVYNEGGNFMTNTRGECLMTTRVSDANAKPDQIFEADVNLDPILDEQGNPKQARRDSAGRKGTLYYDNDINLKVRTDDEYLSNDEIAAYYQRYAGCSKVTIMPRMPHEGTGHIDMWAKYVGDDEILINQISDEQLTVISNPKELKVAKDVQKFLQDRKAQLSNLGYKLTPLSMPLPTIISYEYQGQVYDDTIMRSYTNSLIIQKSASNGLERTALVPQYTALVDYEVQQDGTYKQVLRPYTDDAMLKAYETEVTQSYQAAGYGVKFIASDDLIAIGGAVHCVTMQLSRNVL